jgi:hypothetical protein
MKTLKQILLPEAIEPKDLDKNFAKKKIEMMAKNIVDQELNDKHEQPDLDWAKLVKHHISGMEKNLHRTITYEDLYDAVMQKVDKHYEELQASQMVHRGG